MRLFPFPNNPYDPLGSGPTSPLAGPSARCRTSWAATPFTPFDLRMASGPEADLQDSLLPETLMIRDLTGSMPWLFVNRRILNW